MISLARTSLYCLAIFFSFLAFVLSAAFIGRTENDFGSYNEGSAAVLAASLLILLTLPVVHFLFHRRASTSVVGSVFVEMILLSVLWVIMLGGAAAMSDQLPGLSICDGSVCHLGRATQAFAWLAWITLTVLLALVVALAFLSNRKSEQSIWTRPLDYTKPTQRNTSRPTTTTEPSTTLADKSAPSTNGAPVMSSVNV